MSEPGTTTRRTDSLRELRVPVWVRAINLFLPILIDGYLRFVDWTSRKTVVNEEFDPYLQQDMSPTLFAGWHQGLLYFIRHFRDRNGVVMVSRSQGGTIVSAILLRFGFRPVRGGSNRKKHKSKPGRNRGGMGALAEMINLCGREGHSAGLVCDGSHGPYGDAKIGILLLAKETGLPVVPVGWWCTRSIVLKNWDHTVIPLPFNRFRLAYGEPIGVAQDASQEECELLRRQLNASLMELTFSAQEGLGLARRDYRPPAP